MAPPPLSFVKKVVFSTTISSLCLCFAFLITLYGGGEKFIHDWVSFQINPGHLDPDTWMRLSFLRENLESGRFQYIFSRDGWPNGVEMSWTLPYDMFCILVAFPFRMIGWNWTEAFSLSLPFNLLFLLLLEFYAVWRIAKSLSLQKLYPYIVMILFLSPIIIGYSHLGRMTHHPFTLAISGFMIAETIFFIRKPGIQRGIILGFLMTLSCWESMETFPTVGLMSVFMISVMLLYRQYNTKLPLKYFGVSVIISSIFALAIDYSPRGWDALIVDRYSVFHVEFLCLLGIVSYMIAHYNMVWRDYRTYLVIAISIFISIYIIASVHYPIDLNDNRGML